MNAPRGGIAVNTRILAHELTGVQRYTREVLRHLPQEVETVAPQQWASGPKGHAWEQLVLPTMLGGRVLWSPSNTGPLAVRRQVVTCHDISQLDDPGSLRRTFASWYQFLLPRLYPRAAAIIAISDFTRQRIIEVLRIDPAKIHVIPHGVGEAFSPRPPDECAAIREQFGLPERFVLTLGSLQPRKNLARLVEAWQRLPAGTRDGCALAIAGEAGAGQVFKTLALPELPPDIRLLGRVPDESLPALMSAATVFAHPSFYEGFGLPPLEAMACETPVIAGNRTSLPEVVGDAGILFDPFDVEAIAAALASLLDDEERARRLAVAGRTRASAFTWQRTAGEVLDVLNTTAVA